MSSTQKPFVLAVLAAGQFAGLIGSDAPRHSERPIEQ
jgi:hypothetical protein